LSLRNFVSCGAKWILKFAWKPTIHGRKEGTMKTTDWEVPKLKDHLREASSMHIWC